MTALPTFATEANALQADVNSKQTLATASQTASATSEANAASSAAAAVSSAAAAAGSANVTLWVSGTTYAQNASVISPANHHTYRRTTASGSGTTDPSLDTSNYTRLTGGAMVLLGTFIPTATANVDFLTLFSSLYDTYVVEASGIQSNVGASTDSLLMRLCNAGVADNGAFYIGGGTFANIIGSSVYGAGKALTFSAKITNVNDAGNIKGIFTTSAYQTNVTPTYAANHTQTLYVGANVVTGARLYWNGGSNFLAQGVIRVYGISNV